MYVRGPSSRNEISSNAQNTEIITKGGNSFEPEHSPIVALNHAKAKRNVALSALKHEIESQSVKYVPSDAIIRIHQVDKMHVDEDRDES